MSRHIDMQTMSAFPLDYIAIDFGVDSSSCFPFRLGQIDKATAAAGHLTHTMSASVTWVWNDIFCIMYHACVICDFIRTFFML